MAKLAVRMAMEAKGLSVDAKWLLVAIAYSVSPEEWACKADLVKMMKRTGMGSEDVERCLTELAARSMLRIVEGRYVVLGADRFKRKKKSSLSKKTETHSGAEPKEWR